jgi:glycosyl hydrolase family 57
MSRAITIQRELATIAIVHHANQLVITDGYDNRVGVSSIAGTSTSPTGLMRVLDLHERYRVPFNLHVSGTLLESLAWHCPEFLSRLRHLSKSGLVELIGGSYGQNMMKFFSHEHNLKQLQEHLSLYQTLLDWDPGEVTTFWVTERLWETETVAPVLTDKSLQNGGYRQVLLDDRLLYPDGEHPSPRQSYDYYRRWDPSNFRTYNIRNGNGLRLLPISIDLRQNIPPRTAESLQRIKVQLHWLLDVNAHYDNGLIAIYADDMEKAAGVGWDSKGPDQFETVLKWISENPSLQAVKLAEWTALNAPKAEKRIDPGTYRELVRDFEAGETYNNWYYDPRWAPYREHYTWSENRVRELGLQGADHSLIELAWKVLLASAWQTAWHTPQIGAHGEKDSDGGPSAWTKAVASHSRLAAIMAEAGYWMRHKDEFCHAHLQDIDHDGNEELVLKNNALFAVMSPKNGGRLVYLFAVQNAPGGLVIGNPVDDWNLLEDLHGYMDLPPNHPGALSDVGYEHDAYSVEIIVPEGETSKVKLRNTEKNRSGFGIEKSLLLEQDNSTIRVDYTIPAGLTRLSTEIGFSPDYLQLLRKGPSGVRDYSPTESVRGWSNGSVTAGARLDRSSAFWAKPRQQTFGHGYLLSVTGEREFTVWIGAED